MEDRAVSPERCSHVDFGGEITRCTGRVDWEGELLVDLCCDCWFEYEGDIVVV